MRLLLLSAMLVATLGNAVTPAAAAAAVPAEIGNPQQGGQDFAVCRACHQVGPNARNGVGPALNGIVGRKTGSYPGYAYSAANKNSGITWSVTELQKFLEDPQKLVPGTKMPFAGLRDQTKVNDIIAYLAQFNEKGEKVP